MVRQVTERQSFYRVFALVVLCLSMILVIGSKQNIHVDEFMSYGLSNAKMIERIDTSYQDGIQYPLLRIYL